MCKKLIFLTSLIVVLTCLSTANARYQLKVDLTINAGGPVEYTDKSQHPGYDDWTPWVRWSADLEGHDATRYEDLGGTGLSVGLGMWQGGGPSSTVLDYTIEGDGDDPICNTWLRSRESESSSPEADAHIVLYGDSLVPGTYWVYGFHNTPGGDEPDMPRVYVRTYSGVVDADILMQNVGAPNDPDGGGVIAEINDVDVRILHVSDDNDLCSDYNSDFNDSLYEPNLSFVKFYTDGSPVIITYEAGDDSTAVLNAFIINAPTPYKAYAARPRVGEEYACPDANLTWRAGVYVQDTNAHNVYFGTDLTEEITLFDDDFEAGDANWVPVNWTLYDSNVLGDGNSDGNSHSTYHSMTPGSGAGILTSDTIDTSEAGSTTVELWIKKSADVEAGDIDLYYYDGNNWNFAADLNSIGPNDVWLHYTDEVNDSNYLVSTFKLELRSNISGGELFIDDVSVTNTWPIGDEWFVGNYDPCTYNPPGLLDFNTTYYWRVDEVNDSCDASPWQGHLWSFRTEKGKARDPDPRKSASSKPTAGITLSWTPSCFADQHDIYLSTKFEEVNDSNSVALLGTTYDGNTEIETGPLTFNRRYYWRVNETGSIPLTESDIWYFQTIGYPLMYFKFDGVPDANIGDPEDANFVTDDTGNVTFDRAGSGELRYDQPNPIYNAGGTSAHFTPNGTGGYGNAGAGLLRSCFGGDLLDLDGLAYTIEAWVRQDGDANHYDGGWYDGDIKMDGTIIRKDRFTYGLGIDNDGTVKFMHRGNIIASKSGRIDEGQWYHIAAVFDACAADANEREELYIDGLVVADNNDPCSNPSDDYSSDVVGIGAYRYQSATAKHLANHFNGAIDELRVVDLALEPGDFLIRGDKNLAWLPRPYNYAKEVQCYVDLEWLPGQYADSHDVYIGTNWDDINDVNTSNIGSYPNVDYNNVEVCSYDPWFLGLDQTHYWRVDEVNDACDPNGWRGNIWRFTVADYISIDDMEEYDNVSEGWWYGADLNCGGDMFNQTVRPVRGDLTMKYLYYNAVNWGLGYWSEMQTKDLDPNDWTAYDITVLSLWFYGDWDNASSGVEQMYVGLEDNSSVYRESRYPLEDINDITVEEWQQWVIPISSLNDVNLADLYYLAIGFGERYYPFAGDYGYVYFDDIRLYPGICIPEEGPTGDISGDCFVDWADVEIMSDEWLKSDVNFADLGIIVTPPSPGPVGWWKFDDGDGNVAADSSGYDHNGVIETIDDDVWWVLGRNDVNSALEFDDGRVRVADHPDLRPMDQVSASAWINYSDEQDAARIVVKGADNKETFALEVGDNDQLSFYVGDGNSYDPCDDEYERYFAESDDDELERDEWIHIAGTFDGNSVKCYVNGELAGESNDPNTSAIPFLCQDTNDLAIGNRPDDDNREFEGIIDDVRVYNYGLSNGMVAYVATDSSGMFAVQSVANLSDTEAPGDRAVNMRDFAVLANSWLEKKLWP